jgi:aquaporin Z
LGAAFVAEVLPSMFLVVAVLGSTHIKAPVGFAGIAIGLVLTLIHLVGIPITNTSVNPARSVGPAVFVGSWALDQLLFLVIAPLIGAAIAEGVYSMIRVTVELITTRRAEEALASEQAQQCKQLRYVMTRETSHG